MIGTSHIKVWRGYTTQTRGVSLEGLRGLDLEELDTIECDGGLARMITGWELGEVRSTGFEEDIRHRGGSWERTGTEEWEDL